MTLQEFIDKYKGKEVGYPNDSSYKGECLSLVKIYIKECFGISPPPSGSNSAFGYWSNFPDPLGSVLERVENTSIGIPKQGDVIIWKPTPDNKYGHIAIFIEGSVGSFRSFDQNYNGRQAHVQNHRYNNVVGWLTPKTDDIIPPTVEPITNNTVIDFKGLTAGKKYETYNKLTVQEIGAKLVAKDIKMKSDEETIAQNKETIGDLQEDLKDQRKQLVKAYEDRDEYKEQVEEELGFFARAGAMLDRLIASRRNVN